MSFSVSIFGSFLFLLACFVLFWYILSVCLRFYFIFLDACLFCNDREQSKSVDLGGGVLCVLFGSHICNPGNSVLSLPIPVSLGKWQVIPASILTAKRRCKRVSAAHPTGRRFIAELIVMIMAPGGHLCLRPLVLGDVGNTPDSLARQSPQFGGVDRLAG